MPRKRLKIQNRNPGDKMGGNNFSKLEGISYPTPEEQRCFDNLQYISRKVFKATSVRKELSRLILEKKLMWD